MLFFSKSGTYYCCEASLHIRKESIPYVPSGTNTDRSIHPESTDAGGREDAAQKPGKSTSFGSPQLHLVIEFKRQRHGSDEEAVSIGARNN